MSTVTPTYGFILPGVNDPADQNIWGNQLNSNFSALDTDLKAVSDTADAAAAGTFVGELKAYAGATAPAKWLVCNGAAIDRTVYTLLFAAIGVTWGSGDGTTTFNIPDLGGRVLAGKESVATRLTNAVSGVDGSTLGASGGDQRVQTHNHTVTDPGHTHSNVMSTGGSPFPGSATYFTDRVGGQVGLNNTLTNVGTSTGGIQSNTTGITLANYGAGSSQNVQPVAIVNWLIYAGV